MRKREHMIRAVAVAATLAATGCGSALKHGDVSPDSVEQKARTLTRQTLDAIRPVIGSARTSAEPGTWEQCSTDTPGQHRFEYSYVVDLAVPREQSDAVLTAAKAHFAKEGYRPGVPDPKARRVTATEAHSSWWIGVGVSNGNASMFISVDSDCVFTTHDPPTKEARTGS
jgi:hypothetical protein